MEGTVSPSPESEKFFSRVLLVLIAVAAVLRVPLVFRLNIDGDEFRFLSLVYEHLRGQLGTPLMTIHVYLFQWLPAVSANEADQIVAARVVMLALSLGSAFLTYLIGEKVPLAPGGSVRRAVLSHVLERRGSWSQLPVRPDLFVLLPAVSLLGAFGGARARSPG